MTDASSHSTQQSADLNEAEPDFIKWLKENRVPVIGMAFGALVLCLIAVRLYNRQLGKDEGLH